MLIYCCISAHGFGHGSRTAAVLAALHRIRPSWRLVVSSALPASFLTTAFGPLPIERRTCRWDVGVLQADALGSDPVATLSALELLEQHLPQTIATEAAWLQLQGEQVLVLGDVPPAAAVLSDRIGAPLIWLASFGWDQIYQPLGPSFAPWAERCLAFYRRGDLLLECPLGLVMDWHVPRVQIGLTAGSPRLEARALAHQLDLPANRDRCVLVSFGGLGLPLDPALFSRWPDWVFLGHDPGLGDVFNGRILPADVRPLELMRLCGRLITKPGYSSFCEALSQDVGIHLVHRDGFAEAPVLEEALQHHGWHRLLTQEAFRLGDWDLDQPLLPPSQGPLPKGGAEAAAREIAEFATPTAAS